MSWISIFLALLQAAPQILALILQVEQTIGAGNGGLKKQLVMHAVTVGSNDSNFTAKVSALVDAQVATLNAAGVLAKLGEQGKLPPAPPVGPVAPAAG
jgi:hypothetical protein